jgi:hypothetical protein
LFAIAFHVNDNRVVIDLRVDGEVERRQRFEEALQPARLNGNRYGN